MKNKVAIVILNFNGYKDTLECVDSMLNNSYKNYEIFIVDNNSSGKDYEILSSELKYENIHFIKNSENLGFAGGNNVAVEHILNIGGFEYILLLNNDTVVEKDFLHHLVKMYENNKNVASVGPKILDYYNHNIIDSISIKISHRGGGVDEGHMQKDNVNLKNKKVFGISGCCLLVSTSITQEIIKKTGYFFDPDFFLYYEDVDLAWRIQLLGYESMFCNESQIYHKGSATAGKFTTFKSFYLIRNRLYIIFKYYSLGKICITLYYILQSYFEKALQIFTKSQKNEQDYSKKILKNSNKYILMVTFLKAYWDFLIHFHKLLTKRFLLRKQVRISQQDFENIFTSYLAESKKD